MRTKIILALAASLASFAFAGTTCNQAAKKQVSGLAVYSPDTTTGPTLGNTFEIKWEVCTPHIPFAHPISSSIHTDMATKHCILTASFLLSTANIRLLYRLHPPSERPIHQRRPIQLHRQLHPQLRLLQLVRPLLRNRRPIHRVRHPNHR